MLRVMNGRVYDPHNGITGEARDIWLDGGKVVAEPSGPAPTDAEVIDAAGCVVFPGGIEIHSHVAGSKVNGGRIMCPEDHADHFRPRTDITRAGSGHTVPTTFLTGYEYAAMGYTTLFEAAVPPLTARHAHEELRDIPILDSGCFTVMGNNHLVMKVLSEPDEAAREERLRDLVAWLLHAARAYAVKIVNPGGVESWKWHKGPVDLDTEVPPYGVTSRQILTGLAAASDAMGLPHSVHLHLNYLGLPGNAKVTLESMRALAGHRAHFTHLQFHSYETTKTGSYASGAPAVAELFNEHPEFTCDVGQLVFGPATTMTSDAPMEFGLHHLHKDKWLNTDIEMESGGGVVPMTYSPRQLVNAVQWCTGLELMLLIRDPWRVFLTTDHPNAGPFRAYPMIIRLLMDREYRREWLDKLHPRVKRHTTLHDLEREYTLEEIAIVTRSGQARALGLAGKGHLGAGADADVVVYRDQADVEQMFAAPAYVLKAGQVVARDGKVTASVTGRPIGVDLGEPQLAPDLVEQFESYSTVRLANYAVEDVYVPEQVLIPCAL